MDTACQDMKLFIDLIDVSVGRHVTEAGTYRPVLYLRVTPHCILSHSESLHCFPTHPHLYIAFSLPQVYALEHGSCPNTEVITYACPSRYVLASPGTKPTQSHMKLFILFSVPTHDGRRRLAAAERKPFPLDTSISIHLQRVCENIHEQKGTVSVG